MKQRILKWKHIFVSEERNQGTIGAETPIKDKNGVSLKVGDLIYFEIQEGNYVGYGLRPVVKEEEKAFVMGIEKSFYPDGTYEKNVTLTKIKNHNEIATGGFTLLGDSYIEYCEEEVEE